MLLACVAKCLSVQVKYKEGSRRVQRSVRLSETTLDGAGQPGAWRGEMTASVGERVLKLLHDMSEVTGRPSPYVSLSTLTIHRTTLIL